MRRSIALIGLLPAIAVAALRVQDRPLYAGEEAYRLVTGTIADAHIHLLITTMLLAIYLGSVIILYHKRHLPDEGLLVIALTPAIVTSLVSPSAAALALGALAAIAAANWDRPLILGGLGLLGLLLPGGWILPIAFAAAMLGQKRYAWASAGLALAVGAALLEPPLIAASGLAELGAASGASAAIMLLALMGIVVAWDRSTYPRLLIAMGAISLSLFLPRLIFVGALAASILGGVALHELRTRSWRLEAIKQATLYLLVLAVVFSAVSAGGAAVRADPGGGLLEAAQLLRGEPSRSVFVLQEHYSSARWAGIPVTSSHAAALVKTYRIADARPLLPGYVLLKASDEAEGLWFLIENTDDLDVLLDGEYVVARISEE